MAKEIHIPEILDTGRFYDFRFFQLLDQDEIVPKDSYGEGKTFITQYFAAEQEDYEQYIQHYAPLLRKKAITKWGERFIAFRTLLKSVD